MLVATGKIVLVRRADREVGIRLGLCAFQQDFVLVDVEQRNLNLGVFTGDETLQEGFVKQRRLLADGTNDVFCDETGIPDDHRHLTSLTFEDLNRICQAGANPIVVDL